MTDLIWKNITASLGELKPWAENPRMSTKKQARKLLESWETFGQVETIAVGPGLEVYDGHQRLSALLTVHGKDYRIDARQSNRPLTDDERRKLVITLHAGAVGSWNWDSLSNWNGAQLMESGFDADLLKGWKADIAGLKELIASESEEDDEYSRKIEAPIYTPKGDKPAIKDLFNDTRANELIAEINASDLPDEEKQFLIVAARRHTVLNYKQIANYYAHSSADVQRLMENSALVIIDFERAIELGYVKLSEEIAAQYLKDYPNA